MSETIEETEEKKNKSAVLWKDRKHFMWFPFSFTKYRIQNDRLYKDMGLFTTVSDEVMLYRIIDLTLVRTLSQKIFGTGTILVTTRMNREEVVRLENIKNPVKVKNYISDLVEQERKTRNVVGKEFYGSDIHHTDAMGHEDGPDFDMHMEHDMDPDDSGMDEAPMHH